MPTLAPSTGMPTKPPSSACPPGTDRLNEDDELCVDINECDLTPSLCGRLECENLPAESNGRDASGKAVVGFNCIELEACAAGLIRNVSALDCEDLNECLQTPSPCPRDTTRVNLIGGTPGYKCNGCPTGYTIDATGRYPYSCLPPTVAQPQHSRCTPLPPNQQTRPDPTRPAVDGSTLSAVHRYVRASGSAIRGRIPGRLRAWVPKNHRQQPVLRCERMPDEQWRM